MTKNRTIVDFIAAITPPVRKPTRAAFEANLDGFVVEFRGSQKARLRSGAGAAALLDILDDLQQTKTPVYVELDADGEAIVRLLIPLIAKIAEVREIAGGDIDVVLFPSHARHTLRRDNEDFDALLKALIVREGDDAWQFVTETDRHEIIDVRPYSSDDGPKLLDVPNPLIRLKNLIFGQWLHRLARWWTYRACAWFCCRWPYSCCVPMWQAWTMFNLVASETCDPTTVPPPCIPFLYPDDGCWGRAHEMCRLMIAAGVKPAKVWIQGSLTAATKNNPNCAVHWGWHVAPTLCVRSFFCRKATYVIDPSLFTGPVTEQTWKSVQGDPTATLTSSTASIFYLWGNVTDPNYVQTNQVLATYRNQLKLRSLSSSGPPPYAYC